MLNPDEGKDESYIRRRNLLLEMMKREKWDTDESPSQCKKRGRKSKVAPKLTIDFNKPRNRGYNWVKK